MRYPCASLTKEELADLCRQARRDIVKMLGEAGSGHPGGSLSAIDIIMTLHCKIMRHSPGEEDFDKQDIFVLSKGHGVPALYATYAETGYIPREELMTLRKLGSRLQGHPDRLMLPVIKASTGSLGQGLSVAQGYAMAARVKKTGQHVFCMVGDGECNEGQIWEAVMSAGHYNLSQLTAIVDYNKAQIDGLVHEVMDLEPLRAKWESFGWEVFEIDGHDYQEIEESVTKCLKINDKPQVIIAHTVKGKGVSFMEADLVKWHGVTPSSEEVKQALEELQ